MTTRLDRIEANSNEHCFCFKYGFDDLEALIRVARAAQEHYKICLSDEELDSLGDALAPLLEEV